MIAKVLHSKIFRYFISAGIATIVDISVFYFSYNYLFRKVPFHINENIAFAAPTLSLILSTTCGVTTNFLITKVFVFHESTLKTHKQVFRYVLVALFVLSLNYLMMTFLIKNMGWYPTIARTFAALSIGVLSFLIHKYFSFRVNNKDLLEEEDVPVR
jgi:putative flippase GtrA